MTVNVHRLWLGRWGSTETNWNFTDTLALMGCTQKCWRSWLMLLWSYSWFYCKSVETGKSSWRLEESKYHSYLQERKERTTDWSALPGRAMKQIILKTVSKHMKDEKVNGSNQHGFMKGKNYWPIWQPPTLSWLAWWVG